MAVGRESWGRGVIRRPNGWLIPERRTATINPDFAKDVEAAIAAHREPLEPPAWD